MPCLSASASKIGGEGENSSISGTQVMQTVCYMPKQKLNVLHEWGHFISKLWGDTREREKIVNFKNSISWSCPSAGTVICRFSFHLELQAVHFCIEKHYILFLTFSLQAGFLPRPLVHFKRIDCFIAIQTHFLSVAEAKTGAGVHMTVFY